MDADTTANIQIIGIIGSLCIAAAGLILNALATLKNVKSRRISNYQEITKSHRELWMLTLDDPQKFERILQSNADLEARPITYTEKKFIQLLLLHMTCAYSFSKESDMIEIEKMKWDMDEFLALPLPQLVWRESKKYFNQDFVRFVEGRTDQGWRDLVFKMRVWKMAVVPNIYILKDGIPTGPFSKDQIRDQLNSKDCSIDDLAWTLGEGNWQPLATFSLDASRK